VKVSVVVPNWNGAKHLAACLDSLRIQSQAHQVIVVDNGSTDGSLKLLGNYPEVQIIPLKKNYGFAGGVNPGFRQALRDSDYIALFNNDAIADKDWLKQLVGFLQKHPKTGIVTSKILTADGKHFDSTGDFYTLWGLPYPRGRGEEASDKYDNDIWVFAASGGASLYRAETLKEIGLMETSFFAYYEDIDLSFRAQLAGWHVGYEPRAIVLHHISATSSQLKSFATYHTIKNLPLLFWKDVPWGIMRKVWPRLFIAHWGIIVRAVLRLQLIAVFKGLVMSIILWPKILVERRKIQKNKKVSAEYIYSLIERDPPPNAHKLRILSQLFGGGK
jgi:GT2 family glycosyltransferase